MLLSACETPTEPVAPVEPVEPPQFLLAGRVASATGAGHFNAGVDVTFAFFALQFGPGTRAFGLFHFETVLGGFDVEFQARVTCMAVDPVTNRAWIGGVVTKNRSNHPSFTTPIHQVGRDIWFRMVDYGEGSTATQPDRSTFVGFEGAAGIITSEEYCAARIWPGPPADVVDARTNPVTSGNINVRG